MIPIPFQNRGTILRVSSACTSSCIVLLLIACSHGGDQNEVDLGAGFNQASGSGFNAEALVIAPAIDGSGTIYVGGAFTAYNGTAANRIVRLNGTGTIDSGFSIGTGFDSNVTSIAPLNDGSGRIYVGGSFAAFNGASASRIARLNPDGTLDASFSAGMGFDGAVTGIAPAGDGSGAVYIVGGFTKYNGTAANRIAKLGASGSVDGGFSSGSGFGVAPVEIPQAIALANDGSGSIYIAGTFTAYNGTSTQRVVRLKSDGTLDSGFSPGAFLGGMANVFSLASANDGSGDVYVGGLFFRCFVRLKVDGSPDPKFEPGLGFGFDNIVFSIAPTTDGSGDVYVGGTFTAYNGYNPPVAMRSVRLHDNGTVALPFSTAGGFNDFAASIAPANDGSGDVFVAGGFTSYNGTAAGRIVRLDTDGTLD